MTQSIFFDVVARDRASSTFSRIAKSSESTAARLKRFGQTTAAIAGFTGLTSAAVGFIKVGSTYTSSLNKIQALAGITDSRLGQVANTLEGQSSQFATMGQTTGDAASGMVELIKAGMGVDRALKSVNATMVLAKAGELQVADAASLVSNTLNVFRRDGLRAGQVANILANAANVSSSDVDDLRLALSMAGNVAASSGASLGQTAAMLAELSNAGMKGSDAGTSLKTMLLSLQAPSSTAAKGLKALGINVFDTTGKMRPIAQVLDDTTKALAGLTDKERAKELRRIFGTDAFRAAKVIFGQGSAELRKYTKAVNQAGAAQKLAEANSKGFTGTLAKLKAETISTAQATYRDMQPALDSAAKKLAKFVEQMRSGEGAGGDFVDVLKDVVAIGKGVLSFFNGLPGPVKKYGLELLVAGVAMKKLMAITSSAGASFASPIARMKQFGAELTYTQTRMGAVTRVSQQLGAGMRNLGGAGGMLLLAHGATESNKSVGTLMQTLGGAAAGFAVGGPIGAGVGGLAGLMLGLATNTGESADAASNSIPAWQTYTSTLDDATAAVTGHTRAQIQEVIRQKKLNEVLGDYGYTNRQIVNAIAKGGPLRDRMIAGLRSEAKLIDDTGNALMRKHGAASEEYQDYAKSHKARADAVDAALIEMGAVSESIKKKREDIAATREFSKAVNQLPRSVQSKLRVDGLKPGIQGIVELGKRIKLTPRAIDILLRENGMKPTQDKVQRIQDRLKQLNGTVARPKVEVDGWGAFNTLAEIGRRLENLGNKGRGGSSGGGKGDRVMSSAGRSAGSAYGDGILAGIAKKRMTVASALDRLTELARRAADKLSNLREIRAGFLETFSSDSIFGADLETTGKSLSGLIAFQQQQAQKAAQLAADVKTLTGMGLSKSLIAQLQAQGSSGAEQLHLLAGGSADQIRMLNALNAQTQASLQAAGMTAGNAGRGGSIDSDIAKAKRDEELIERIIRRLKKHDDDKYVVVYMNGQVLFKAQKERNRTKGVARSGV